MEEREDLLINGSLVRAQQAEPINQELSGVSDAPLVLNLEPGSKPPPVSTDHTEQKFPISALAWTIGGIIVALWILVVVAAWVV